MWVTVQGMRLAGAHALSLTGGRRVSPERSDRTVTLQIGFSDVEIQANHLTTQALPYARSGITNRRGRREKMEDDTVENYLGREAEWAALCAFDGLEASESFPDPSEAKALMKNVWEFVSASCEEAGQTTPDPEEAAKFLAELIAKQQTSR
jgi:hypothetical protein